MNLVYDATHGMMVRKVVTVASPFTEVDDALYFHERRYYSAVARNSNDYPTEDLDWVRERARLTALWHSKCPYRTDVDPCAIKGAGFIQRFISWLKP